MQSALLDLDLQSILLLIGIVMNSLLGLLIFIKRGGEYVNRVYVFNIICIVWWSVMIVIYREISADLLWWTIGLYVTPTFIASSFLYFTFFFPEEHPRIHFRPAYLYTIIGFNAIVVLLTLIPGVIIDRVVDVVRGENIIYFGPLYPLYSLYISGFFGLGLLILARKLFLLKDSVKRRQLVYLLWGYLIASTFAMVTNLTMPYLGYFSLNWLGQVFTVFMVLPVTYAIFKHRLFDMKVVATELITISLWLFLFVRLLLDTDSRARLIDALLLLVMIVIGVLLIRSVNREVRQREQLEVQEEQLQAANQQQESLLHFISHEIKGYLTKNEAAFAAISAGDFGPAPEEIRIVSDSALKDTRSGVATVMDILDASNLKRGTMEFKKVPFNLSAAIEQVVNELQPTAKEKGLELAYHKPITGPCTISGDEEKIRRHVIRNIIDNSIKYTPSGSVRVDLIRAEKTARIIVTDTGVGITPEDMERLFTEGGHGKDSIKVNVHSTGYGLFIAKQIVIAHGGKIWAESDGAGKGSRFIIEFSAQ